MPSGIADIARLEVDVNLSEDHGRVEGYTDPDGVADIVESFLLFPDPGGNVLIHEAAFSKGLSRGPSTALTALDLASSLDVRERSVGLKVLDRLLARFGHYEFVTPIELDIGVACCPTHGTDIDSLKRATDARLERDGFGVP